MQVPVHTPSTQQGRPEKSPSPQQSLFGPQQAPSQQTPSQHCILRSAQEQVPEQQSPVQGHLKIPLISQGTTHPPSLGQHIVPSVQGQPPTQQSFPLGPSKGPPSQQLSKQHL